MAQCGELPVSGRNGRLNIELKRLRKRPPTGITVLMREDSKDILDVVMTGEEGTPFEGGVFILTINIPDRYPFSPPHVKFTTPVYHPNIDNNGLICLDILKTPPAGDWRPILSLGAVLTSIRLLLGAPNPSDPLMPEIAEQFLYRKAEYEQQARAVTSKHAMGVPAAATTKSNSSS